MTMQDKNTATGELSYFETTLLLYLKKTIRILPVTKNLYERGPTRRQPVMNVPYVTVYPLCRLCNWPKPFSIRTCAFPDSIRFSRSCRSGFPK